jgi:serine/threonine-protein kinase
MVLALARLPKLATAALLAALGLFAAEPAHAQDASGKAAAEALFESGVQLMKAGRFAEACPKLETSQRVDPGVGTLLYLAECYERLGRTASAWATFREAESLARASNQADRARTAQARAQKLEPELSYLTVSLAPEARIEGLVVRRGATVVLPGLYGVAAPVDPGVVEIDAGAPGHRRYSAQVKVGPRAKEVVTVPKLEAEPAAEPLPASPPAPGLAPSVSSGSTEGAPSSVRTDSPPESEPDHTLAYVVGGVGIIGIGIGSYFGLRAISKNSDAEAFCKPGNACTQEGLNLTEEADNAATISNIGFALGGAALATGVVLYFMAPGGDETTALRVAPAVAKNGAGLSVGGTFR